MAARVRVATLLEADPPHSAAGRIRCCDQREGGGHDRRARETREAASGVLASVSVSPAPLTLSFLVCLVCSPPPLLLASQSRHAQQHSRGSAAARPRERATSNKRGRGDTDAGATIPRPSTTACCSTGSLTPLCSVLIFSRSGDRLRPLARAPRKQTLARLVCCDSTMTMRRDSRCQYARGDTSSERASEKSDGRRVAQSFIEYSAHRRPTSASLTSSHLPAVRIS
jgi:hypothetical protein